MGHRTFICSLLLVAVLHTVHSQNKPPEITTPSAASTELKEADEHVILKCEAKAVPPAKYKWSYKGVDIISSSTVIVNERTGDLDIVKFTDVAVGDYQCSAVNVINGNEIVAMSAVTTLLQVEFDARWDVKEEEVKSKAGNYTRLTCDDRPKSVPKALFSWYLAQGDVSKGEIKENERIYIDNEGTLHFMYLLKSDEEPKLRYKCGLYNSIVSSIRLGSPKNLIIAEGVGSLPQQPPKLRYRTGVPSDQLDIVGSAQFLITKNAELECVFSGNPIPTIRWKNHRGEPMTTKGDITISQDGRKMTLNNLEETDEGTYKCYGTNSGANDIEGKIFLDVTSVPIWEEALSSQTVVEGKDAVFTCKARKAVGDKDSISEPIWYKNGGTVPTSGKYEFSERSKVLTVKNTNKATDIMCFQCEVSNHIGKVFADGCLNVIEPIVIDVQPPHEQRVSKGDIVNLTVIGHTDPAYNLTYIWIFNGTRYDKGDNPPFVTFDKTTMQGYINTSALSDGDYRRINGTYYRLLSHKHDSNTVAIDVILTELPVIGPLVVTGGLDLWWIALVVALIILIIVVILIVVICNRMRQEGTYPLDKKERANDIDPEKDLADSGFHDLARASGDDDYPTKKSQLNPNFDYGDDMDMGDDDESLMEYGAADYDTSKFNEDGSFIGQYVPKDKTPEVKQNPVPLNHHSTESQI